MPTKTPQLWVPIARLPLPHLGVQEYKWHSSFQSVSQLQYPVPQYFPLSSLFPIFPQSLSLWPASPQIARKEADIPKFRYSPDLPPIYLPEICRSQNRDFSQGANSWKHPTWKKKTKQPNLKHHTFYFFLLVVFK